MGGGYRTGEKKYSNLAFSFHVQTGEFAGIIENEHPGVEIVFAPNSRSCAKSSMTIRGHEYLLARSPILVYNSAEPHKEKFTGPNQNFFALVFPTNSITRLLGNSPGSDNIAFDDVNIAEVFPTNFIANIYWILRDWHADDLSLQGIAEGFLTELFQRVPSSLSTDLGTAGPTDFRLARRVASKIIRSFQVQNFGLVELENELGVTRFHIIRSFRNLYGITPHKFLTSCRLGLVTASRTSFRAWSSICRSA